MKRAYFSTRNFVVTTALIGLTAGTFGCSTATPVTLIEARESYQQAEKNPNMTGNAAVALRDAQLALNHGEREWEQNHDQEEAEHQAYVIKQRVEIAQRIAERNLAEKDIGRLNEERQKVIVEAREREADRARRQTLTAQSVAKKAQDEAEQARQTTAQTQVEADAARKREEDLQKQLADLQSKMKQTDRGLVLTLGDVLFEFNKAELRAGTLRNLYPLVSFLKENPSRAVTIEGYTDDVGAESYNLDLSERRAEAVRRFLLENGLDRDRITARGLGEADPVASNSTESGRQMNRRVEIVISNEMRSGQSAK